MLKHCLMFACVFGLVACFGDDNPELDADAGVDGGFQIDAAPPRDLACRACRLEVVMPMPGVDCGTQGLEGRDAEVASCVQQNLASSKPFHAVVEVQGVDSEVKLGWVLDETGTLTQFLFDSSICGGSGCEVMGCGPRVSVAICHEPSFIPDQDAGSDNGTELIACGEVEAQPDACAP